MALRLHPIDIVAATANAAIIAIFIVLSSIFETRAEHTQIKLDFAPQNEARPERFRSSRVNRFNLNSLNPQART
jgi:hypothetical protein